MAALFASEALPVDPLASSKGFWADLLGVGRFYYELAIQIVEVCVATRAQNGGLMSLDELRRRVIVSSKRTPEDVTIDDLCRAIDKLQVLGRGFERVQAGAQQYVQSVPRELNVDHSAVIDLATGTAFLSPSLLRDKNGWTTERITKTLEELLKEGLVWVDLQAAPETRYWFPGVFSALQQQKVIKQLLCHFTCTYFAKGNLALQLSHNQLTQLYNQPAGGLKLAVDVACGSGQATFPVAKIFEKVRGFDISAAQISAATSANTLSNVLFEVAPCDKLPVESETAALVIVSQAMHWFEDLKAFYDEATRVLLPGGALCVVSYKVPIPRMVTQDDGNLEKEMNKLYKGTLDQHWTTDRDAVDNGYLNYPKPAALTDHIRDTAEIIQEVTLDDYINYLTTWSPVVKFKQENPNENLLENVRERMLEINNGKQEIKLVFLYHVLLYRKPRNE